MHDALAIARAVRCRPAAAGPARRRPRRVFGREAFDDWETAPRGGPYPA